MVINRQSQRSPEIQAYQQQAICGDRPKKILVHQASLGVIEEERDEMDISITPSRDYVKRELGASDKIKAGLAALREEAVAKQWTFEVGYTSAMDFAIEKITGMKPPADWR